MRALLILLFALVSCTNSSSLTEFEKEAFDMKCRVLIGTSLSKNEQDSVEKLIDLTFDEVDRIYNNWNPRSEISALNQIPAFEKTTLSPQLASLLHLADTLYVLSEGRFDATIEPLQQIWKRHLKQGLLPPSDALQQVKESIGWNHIHLEGNVFWKDSSYTALDVGGISKGFALDVLADRLQNAGYFDFYLEWGGEVRTSGMHPNNRPWRLKIAGMDTIEMHDGAIATSGDYFQCWEVEGTCYFHIIDPRTQEPLKQAPGTIATTSVYAPSCALADGLATCLMLFSSPEEASTWAEHLNVQYWIGARSS